MDENCMCSKCSALGRPFLFIHSPEVKKSSIVRLRWLIWLLPAASEMCNVHTQTREITHGIQLMIRFFFLFLVGHTTHTHILNFSVGNNQWLMVVLLVKQTRDTYYYILFYMFNEFYSISLMSNRICLRLACARMKLHFLALSLGGRCTLHTAHTPNGQYEIQIYSVQCASA